MSGLASPYSRALSSLIGLLAGAIIVTLMLTWWARTSRPRGTASTPAPATTVAGFPAGRAGTVRGRVGAIGAVVSAPLTGRRGVYYELDIEPLEGEPVRERHGREFSLDDGTGVARIRLDGATVTPAEPACVRGALAEVAGSPGASAVLRRLELSASELTALRFRECVLPVGARVSVTGVAAAAATDAGADAALLMRARPGSPLRVVAVSE